MDKSQIETLLVSKFAKKHVTGELNHFAEMATKFLAGEWEPCISKAGKFVEAALKALGGHAGLAVPTGRQFKADAVITGLGQLAGASFEDTIRLTIPRACRFVYDIASNRGARHDPDEIDPNEMDAAAVVPTCSWIVAEMIRYAQKGTVDTAEAKEIVESLSARRYPLIEEIDGRVYFHHPKKSAADVALLALAYRHAKRINQAELIATIKRHGFRNNNANLAVTRIRKFVDNDGNGNLRLLAPGLKKAEEIMS
jgi:hypothetical protein